MSRKAGLRPSVWHPVMVLLPLLGVSSLLVWPIASTIWASFQIWDRMQVIGWGSLSGYSIALQPQRTSLLAVVCLRSLIVSLVALLISIPLAEVALRSPLRWRLWFLGSLALPFFVSDVARAFGWRYLSVLSSTPLGLVAVVVAQLAVAVPICVFFTIAVLPKSENSLWKASSDIGLSTWERLRGITFPLATVGALSGGLCAFWISFGSSVEPMVLDAPLERSVSQVVLGLRSSGEFSATSALSVVILATVVGTWIAGSTIADLFNRRRSQRIRRELVRCRGVSLGSIPVSSAAKMACLVLVVLAVIFISGGVVGTFPLARFISSSSVSTAFGVAESSALISSVIVSVVVGIVTAILGFSIGLLWWNPVLRRWVILFLALLALLPGDTLALGLLQGAKLIGIQGSSRWLLGLGLVSYALPYAAALQIIANISIPDSIIKAAQELRPSSRSTVFHIVLGLTKGSVISAALLSALLSFNEYVRTSYLSGSDPAWSQYVLGKMRSGADPGVYLAGLVTVAVAIAIFAGTVWITKKSVIRLP